MTCPCSASRFRWLRHFCSLVCAVVGCCSLPPAKAQNLDKPLQSIDEDITALAHDDAADIAYSDYRRVKTKDYKALEHDYISTQDSRTKQGRQLERHKYTHRAQTF